MDETVHGALKTCHQAYEELGVPQKTAHLNAETVCWYLRDRYLLSMARFPSVTLTTRRTRHGARHDRLSCICRGAIEAETYSSKSTCDAITSVPSFVTSNVLVRVMREHEVFRNAQSTLWKGNSFEAEQALASL